MPDLQFHPSRRVDLDQVDDIPRDDPWREVRHQRLDGTGRNQVLQQASHRTTRTNFHTVDDQRLMSVGLSHDEIHIIHTNDLPSVNVYDLLVEQIAFQEEKTL